MSSKKISKCLRKQKVAGHKIFKDFNVRCIDLSTQNVAICNAGLVTGMSRETLKKLLDDMNIIQNYDIIMPVGKSYSFIEFSSPENAQKFFNNYNGSENIKSDGSPLYLSFTDSVPDSNQNSNEDLPHGLRLINNFVTEEEAAKLLNIVDWENEIDNTSELKHRKAKHFGYIFKYDDNRVDLETHIQPIPKDCDFLQNRFEQENCGFYLYDQLTVNRYLPGQGIPPHIDTHSIFEDTILSLSLGSDCVMDFKKDDKKVSILLPQRSLLIMKDEARYAWSHGIGPRHSDIVNAQDGTTFQPRSTRVSFTFRKVRSGNCLCKYPKYCDTQNASSTDHLDAVNLENRYVHEVYEQISSHFSETRHKQWPNVTHFLDSLPLGSILVDVGCGNGKYLVPSSNLYKIGCDRSSSLIEISRQRGFEVLVADCLKLPYRDSSVDAAISIAVIHHLSTHERRRDAIQEMNRILRPEGKLLIYVWAKSQKKDSVPSAYLKYSGGRKSATQPPEDETKTVLPVHQNGTEFTHDDVFVPWKRKGGGEFLRYYHVFDEGELEKLCSEIDQVSIERVYYDQGNWCAILKKIKE